MIGRKLMILAAIFLITGFYYARSFEGIIAQIAIAITFIVGFSLLIGGYALYRWETKRERGWNKDFDLRSLLPAFSRSNLAPNRIPPPENLPTHDAETGEKLCIHYFYDLVHRFPCLQGCKYPSGRAACTSSQTTPVCPYPLSRAPLVVSLMPRPVAWCPGPGGCRHFLEGDYSCQLALRGVPHESYQVLGNKGGQKLFGIGLMGMGLVFGLTITIITWGVPLLGPMAVIAGLFVGLIGWVILQQTKEGE